MITAASDHGKLNWTRELAGMRLAIKQGAFGASANLSLSKHADDHQVDPTRHALDAQGVIDAILRPEAVIIEGYAPGAHIGTVTGKPNPDPLRLVYTITETGQPVHIIIASRKGGRFKVVTHYDPRTRQHQWDGTYRVRVP